MLRKVPARSRQKIKRAAHKVWMNHLRQWSRNDAAATRLGLEPAVLQQIAEVLVVASYRLNLPQQLQRIVETDKSSAAQLHAVIGNFVGWLGYDQTPVAERPASRIRKGQAIFVTPVVSCAARLTRWGTACPCGHRIRLRLAGCPL